MKSRHLPYYIFVISYWVIGCTLLVSIVKFTLITFINVLAIDPTAKSQGTLYYINSAYPYLEAILAGISFGTVFIVSNNLANRIKKLRALNFAFIIVLKSILFLVGMLTAILLLYYAAHTIDFSPIKDMERLIDERGTTAFQFMMMFYFIGMALLLNFLQILARKFGLRNLMNLIIGKYASPKEENKIFLFMDLRSSTQYGEQLEHDKYSKLLRDCFSELNSLIIKYNADIYQYVGDEVVLTWDFKKNKNNSSPIEIYFAFRKRLLKKKHYFIKKYGILPEFKAGAHGGKVTVTEIGDLKREIAYHGDAINTASRIQGACNDFNAHCLISKDLLNTLSPNMEGYKSSLLGNVKFKGKEKAIEVYAINSLTE